MAVLDTMVVKLVADTNQHNTAFKQASKEVDKYTRGLDGKLRKAQGRFVAGQKAMAASIGITGASLRSLGARMTGIGRTLRFRLTLPLTIFGGLAVREFAKFDQAMIESTSIMKVTTAQTIRMRDAAISLSGRAPQSATELAKGYFFLASAGKDAEQSIALLPIVSSFATAGAFDLAQATDLLTDAQSALGLTSKDVATDTENLIRVSDVLVGANTLANASVEQFAIALTSKAGSALKAFGIDIEEGVAVLAAFADQGVKAQLAGNQLDRVIRLLSKSALDNAKAHKRLGFAVFDSSGEMRNLGSIIGNLEDVLRGMSDEAKVTTLAMLGFEARVQQAILPLLGTSDAIAKNEKALRGMKGITEEVTRKQMKSFSNRIKIVWNQIKNFSASIGKDLAPMILSLGQKIKGLIEGWNGLDASTRKIIIGFSLAAAAVGPLFIALGSLAVAVGVLGPLLAGPAGLAVIIAGIPLIAFSAGLALIALELLNISGELAVSIERMREFNEVNLERLGGKTKADREEQREAGVTPTFESIDRSIEAHKAQLKAAEKELDIAREEAFGFTAFEALGPKGIEVQFNILSEKIGFGPTKGAEESVREAKKAIADLEKLKSKIALDEKKGKKAKAEKDKADQAGQELETARKLLEKQTKIDDKAGDLVKTLDRQLATLGMTTIQAQIYGLEEEKANRTIIERLRLQDALIQKKREELGLQKSLEEQAKKLLKDNRTDVEQLKDKKKEIDAAVKAGIAAKKAELQAEIAAGGKTGGAVAELDQFTAKLEAAGRAAFAKFGEQFVGKDSQPVRTVSRGVRTGTSEAFRILELAGRGGKNVGKTKEEIEIEKTNATLLRIETLLEKEAEEENADFAGAGA